MNQPKLTRRKLITHCGWGLAALATGAGCRTLRQFTDAKPKGFSLGVCDWTIGKRADPESFTIAHRLGLDGVQVDLGRENDDLRLRNPDVQKKFLEASQRFQLKIASLAIGELNRVPYKSDERARQWVADSIEVCQALGVRVVLLAFFGKGDLTNDPAGVDEVVKRLRTVAPKAERAGVILGIESWLSADQHMAIIDRVGSPAVKVYYDLGNSHKRGLNIYQEIRDLGQEHICEFHAKDYDDLFGKGSIDFVKVRQAMDDIGYRGWIQIENVKTPLGMEASCQYNTDYLRRVFPRVPRIFSGQSS